MSTTTPLDLSKLIVIKANITVRDLSGTNLFLFRQQEQYTFDRKFTQMEGCSCSAGQQEVTYYQVTICERKYLLNAAVVVEDRHVRIAEYNAPERRDAQVRTIPNGGFTQHENYYPKGMLARMDANFKDRTPDSFRVQKTSVVSGNMRREG